MTTHRKTIPVAFLIEATNHMLANSIPQCVNDRYGMIAVLELALHKANAYKGFNYLPGMVDIDETRRFYYKASWL